MVSGCIFFSPPEEDPEAHLLMVATAIAIASDSECPCEIREWATCCTYAGRCQLGSFLCHKGLVPSGSKLLALAMLSAAKIMSRLGVSICAVFSNIVSQTTEFIQYVQLSFINL